MTYAPTRFHEAAADPVAAEPAFLARIRLRARRLALWLRHHWAAAPGVAGLVISHEEVDRLLREPADLARAELEFYTSHAEARALTAAIQGADLAAASDAMLTRLQQELDLTDADVDLLTLTVAVDVDPWLRRVLGYLHDDATSALPTPWVARQMFQWHGNTPIGPESGLVRWRLARPMDGQQTPWSTLAPWCPDPFAVACLTRGVMVDPALRGAVELFVPARTVVSTCLYPSTLLAMDRFVRSLTRDGDAPPIEIVVSAPRGAGKRTLAKQLATELRMPLVIADVETLRANNADTIDTTARIVRSARLAGAAVYWHIADTASSSWHIGASAALSIVGTTGQPATDVAAGGAVRRTFKLPALSQAERATLWSTLSDRAVPAPVLDWALLPSDIARAAAAAAAGNDAVLDACRGTLPAGSLSLATPLDRPYDADDLVVPPATRRHLDELEAQARLRWPVYEEWGFGRLCPMGRGISALFAGPSGTGKTMAAQVLARSLGMDICRVDLAGVMSKYIGETEKHLRQVFDACERANVLLFFDEADALFGQRMDVKDAHDRFANIEIDYLLQRMEQFDGLSILATNRKHEVDPAFLRRLRFIIDFVPPGLEQRRELWTRALPARAPNGEALLEAIDFDVLAGLTMTGADIKSTAMAAAFLARADRTRIGMTHVLQAARRELAKHGVVIRGGEFDGFSEVTQ